MSGSGYPEQSVEGPRCGDENTNLDGCYEIFPFMDPKATYCHRCKRLAAAESEADRQKIKAMNQCQLCGICSDLTQNPCGTCRNKQLQVSGEKDVAFENARMSRSLAVGSQFKNRRHTPSGDQASVPLTSSMAPPPVPSTRASIVMPPPSAPPTQASVVMPSLYQTPSRMVNRPSNSSVLQQRPHIIPPTYFPTISLVVQLAPLGGKAGVERQLVKSFGNTAFNLQNNITLDDALREVLISINQDWEKDHQHSIDFEECEFRFPNNYRLQKEDRESTLGQFLLSIQTYRPEFWTPAPGAYAKKPKFSYLYLHVAVDLAMYSRRTDLVESSLHGPSSLRRGKKRAKVDDLIFGQPETKRARGSTILQSSFSGRSLFTVPSASTVTKPISFKISKCYINETTGDAELRLNDGDEEGKISEEPMSLSREDIGQMKHIYELSWSSRTYVAKQYHTLNPNDDHPTTKNLEEEISNAFRLLSLLKSFVDKFFKTFRGHVALLSEFMVSESFLIESDLSLHDHGRKYLVEPRRPSTRIRKFSGTLQQREHSDKLGSTINAFCHWVMQDTAAQLCFADLQGTECSQNKKFIYVLFDPMAHTLEGNSGIGDHGVDGIQEFIKQHKCTHICDQLDLASMDQLTVTINDHINPQQEIDDADYEPTTSQSSRSLRSQSHTRPLRRSTLPARAALQSAPSRPLRRSTLPARAALQSAPSEAEEDSEEDASGKDEMDLLIDKATGNHESATMLDNQVRPPTSDSEGNSAGELDVD